MKQVPARIAVLLIFKLPFEDIIDFKIAGQVFKFDIKFMKIISQIILDVGCIFGTCLVFFIANQAV